MNDEKQFVFGSHPVMEKLEAAPSEVIEILISTTKQTGSPARAIEASARSAGIAVHRVAPAILDRFAAGHVHQGFVARIRPFSYRGFPELLRAIQDSNEDQVLILDGVTDPRNFGALLRTAEAAGVKHVVIPKDRSVDVTATVVKASAGAAHYLKIYKVTNLQRTMAALKERGFWLIGLDARGTSGIYDQIFPEKLGIVLGSEGAGIRPLIRRECDFLVSIPMRGRIASLNVAVAGAVLLYEVFRQKRTH
ncbi:MAG TPA: 23S rRNA (guanosine(2251)-2'-O)-methyltransferase RlmB [Candidatus Binatia bacterium]